MVQLATSALEKLRRQAWQEARRAADPDFAAKYKGARWALLKNPGDLTEAQQATLEQLKSSGGKLWRGYQMKETLREVFAGDLDPDATMGLLQDWCDRAQRSRIPEFVTAAGTIRKHRAGIAAAIEIGLSNARSEGNNNKVRTMIRRAYGFHTAEATLALIMLTCGTVKLELPYQT